MKRSTRVWLVLAFVVACGLVGTLLWGRALAFAVVHRLTTRKFPHVQWIGTDSLARWRSDPARPQPLLLDARTETEFVVSHLEGARRIDPYYPDFRVLHAVRPDTPIVVYCSVGYRSARVAQRLVGEGFTRVWNLKGSAFEWANEERPLVNDQGPTNQVHPYDSDWGYLLESKHRFDAPDLPKKSAAP